MEVKVTYPLSIWKSQVSQKAYVRTLAIVSLLISVTIISKIVYSK